MLRLLLRVWDRWFGQPLRKVEDEALAYRLSEAGRRFDWKTATVLITAAAALTLQNYTSSPDRLIPAARLLVGLLDGPEAADAAEARLRAWSMDRVAGGVWWALGSAITYTVPPVLVIWFVFRERVRDYGTKLRGALDWWPVYAVFVMVMGPLVWFFSAEERFLRTYPMFYVGSAEHVRADLWKWELSYGIQFIGLEFFFRGFMVHGTKHRFGIYSIFVMTLPYCMIHFAKPIPECAASIIAGVVLGTMSLVTRSIWLGAGIHIAVAMGMDLACLARRGLLA